MSYILDALRRAEAERERGAVPGLHARPAATAATPPARRGRPLLWAAGGAALVSIPLLVWQSWPAAPQAAVAAMPEPVPRPRPAAVAPAPRQAAAAVVAPEPPPTPARVARSEPTVPAPPPAPASAAVQPPAPAPATRAADAPVPLRELPEALRRELPPLTLGGGMHSPDPAARLLIVNGQVQREKATIAPGLVLESIGPHSAVFRFRQQRVDVPY